MPRFSHDGVEIAFLDEGRGRADRAGARLCLQQGGELGLPGWVTTLTRAGRRVIALDNRGHGQSTQALRTGRLSQRRHGRGRARAARSSRARVAPTSWAIRWARASRRSWRWRIPERVRSAVLGGLGISLVEGVGPAGNDRARRSKAPSARRCDRSDGPYVPRLRRADAVRPARACRLHARLAPDAEPRRGRPHRGAGLGRGRQQRPDRGLAGGARRAHSRARGRLPFPAATTCWRSATGCSRPACSSSWRSDLKELLGQWPCYGSGQRPSSVSRR